MKDKQNAAGPEVLAALIFELYDEFDNRVNLQSRATIADVTHPVKECFGSRR